MNGLLPKLCSVELGEPPSLWDAITFVNRHCGTDAEYKMHVLLSHIDVVVVQ